MAGYPPQGKCEVQVLTFHALRISCLTNGCGGYRLPSATAPCTGLPSARSSSGWLSATAGLPSTARLPSSAGLWASADVPTGTTQEGQRLWELSDCLVRVATVRYSCLVLPAPAPLNLPEVLLLNFCVLFVVWQHCAAVAHLMQSSEPLQ